MFRGIVNPTTGKLEWMQQDGDVTSEDTDLSPELARSQYGDMLHDTLRNRMYCVALERAVEKIRQSGKDVHVLDIGTGTGLLAMMAARAGASKVTACEMLRPMVRIARQVITENGYSDIIRIVPKRSTEMTEADMDGRANILVSEVFDTELIGEGALVTYAQAHRNLLERGCIVIPRSATLYVQLVRSDFLWKFHKLTPDKFPVELQVPSSWEECTGAPSLWDLHVEEVRVPDQLQVLSEPTEIAMFPFQDPELSPDHSSPPVVIPATNSGQCHGLVVWWSADMEGEELSMDPWNYPQWRDHWLQAVQLLPQPMPITKGELISVASNHDDYSIWFTVTKKRLISSSSVERPLCTCGVHTIWSRTRVGMINDPVRNQMYLHALTEALEGKSTVVCVSDASMLPLLIAMAGISSIKQVFTVESSSHSVRVMRDLLEINGLTNTVHIIEKSCQEISTSDLGNQLIDAVIGEPYFFSSLLPWHNIHFWYACSALRSLLAPDCVFLPHRASLKAIAVNFDHLYKLRAPVGVVEGFDLSAFDRTVGKVAISEEGVEPEPHPLWEYPCYAKSDVCELLNFDLTSAVPISTTLAAKGMIPVHGVDNKKPCHGVVLWMDYHLTEKLSSTTGLLNEPTSLCEKLDWDPSFRQAVYFLPPSYIDSASTMVGLKYSVDFHTASGQLKLDFTAVQ